MRNSTIGKIVRMKRKTQISAAKETKLNKMWDISEWEVWEKGANGS